MEETEYRTNLYCCDNKECQETSIGDMVYLSGEKYVYQCVCGHIVDVTQEIEGG